MFSSKSITCIIYWFMAHNMIIFTTARSFFPKYRICFDHPPIGCFSRKAPFDNTRKLPRSPESIDIHYNHTVDNDSALFHWRDAPEVMATRFRPDLRTVLIIHGFEEHGSKDWIHQMVDVLTNLPELINVIVLGWEEGAKGPGYPQAAANGRVVSAMGALFVKNLISLGADPASFHIIGYSLGAHIAGGLAARVPNIGRVTGLDPARRMMEGYSPEVRLDPTDANFVDVLHTDGQLPFGYGSMAPMGTVDYYANGGLTQPGCSDVFWGALMSLLIPGREKCSHSRARKIFTDTISMCVIKAARCFSIDDMIEPKGSCSNCREGKSCVSFGYHMQPTSNLTGIYYFDTNNETPFCNIAS